jgi:mevalonate kinase
MRFNHWLINTRNFHGDLAVFKCSAHAKWILAGEHAVLRGHPAIVFPKMDSQLKLQFEPADRLSISLDTPSENIEQLEALIKTLLIQKKLPPINGILHFDNHIPMGKGFGFSAALSICLAKLLIHFGLKEPLFSLAHQIEHHFHGKSSGLDIAGCLYDKPIYFQNSKIIPLEITSWPHIQLIDSGISARSSLCIQKVYRLFESNPNLAHTVDQEMKISCLMAKEALLTGDIKQLADAIEKGQSCFSKWGLITPEISGQIKMIKENGAIACKLSGAGLGGLLIGLYD